MAQSLNLKIRGVYTYPNDLVEVPPGALSEGDEIVIDRESIAEPRRGFGYLTHGAGVRSDFPDPSARADKYFFYQNQILAAYSYSTTHKLAYHDSTLGWVSWSSTYDPPSSSVPIRSTQSNENFYFTTSAGVKKLDAYNGTPTPIGVPQALDLTSTIADNVTPTATTTNGSNVLTSVSSVSGVAIGMQVTGTNVPASSYITAFNATTITISNNCTGNGSGITMTISAPATFLSSGSGSNTTAYRLLWTITDANQNLIEGAPSGISQIVNTTASTAAVINNFTIPANITTSHKYQLYRSLAVAVGVTPSDEGQLCYEGSVTSADITYGQISVLDIVPDTLLGATIYTAQSQEGLAQQNVIPPFCNDIAVFRNNMFLANTSTLEQYNLTLLGTGTPAGIQNGDTITIGGIAYTASTSSENTSTGQFYIAPVVLVTPTGNTNSNTTINSISAMTSIAVGQLITGTGIPAGTYITAVNGGGSSITISRAATATAAGVTLTITGDSAAQAIRDTAISLCRVINRYASSVVYAYYLSGTSDLPGKMLFVGRSETVSQFAVVSSRATCWSPALPTSGTSQQSNDDDSPNFLYYSKDQQPEAIPLGNYLPVGSGDKAILRIVALRDALFVFKEDGIFYVTGTDASNFQVFPLDFTTNLVAPESAVPLNNQIYCLTTQGVCAVTQNGVSIMSRAIENELINLISVNYDTLQTASFGVAYESSRAYYIFTITNASDTDCTQYWRYNYITDNWTHSNLSKGCGAVNPVDDKLYLGNLSLPITDVENKEYEYTDYSDYQSTQDISDVTGQTITISAADTIVAGSILFQSTSVFSIVDTVDPIAGTVTTTLPTDLVTGACDVLAPIATNMQWAPFAFQNPGLTKQARECALIFRADFNGPADAYFSSDIVPTETNEPLDGPALGTWGLFVWGGPAEVEDGVVWGGDPRRRAVRISIPRNQQRCSQLFVRFAHSYAYSPWRMEGISVIGNIVSERLDN